jgi:rhodanese-related sulfurtransferase
MGPYGERDDGSRRKAGRRPDRHARKSERERAGAIPGSLHAPYADLQENIGTGGLIHELALSGKTIVFYCAFGERSAMAVQAAQDVGLTSARHIEGGMAAWRKAGGATC